jgi:adenylate kinase family enzyme
MKKLILLRGLPGSGKSTFAKVIRPSTWNVHIEADMFFIDPITKEYKFNGSKLKLAHNWCLIQTQKAMVDDDITYIVVSNTFTQEWEMEPYYKLAEENGYMVFSIIVENRHNGVNIHGAPEDKLKQMKDRFEIKL